MSRVLLNLPDNAISVSNYVRKSIIDTIIRKTGFPSDGEIDLVETDEVLRKRDGEDAPEKEDVRTRYSNRVRAIGVDRISEQAILQRLRSVSFNTPLIHDPVIGIAASTLYLPIEAELEMTFSFKSKSTMNNWLDRLAIAEKFRPLSYTFDIQYNYAFPEILGNFVKHVHDLRELNDGYGDTLEEYVDSIVKTPTITRSNRSGSYQVKVVNELQRNIEGHFVTETFYNSSTADKGKHDVSITFKYNYERASAIAVDFPFMVHNSSIDSKYIDSWVNRIVPVSVGEEKVLDGRVIGGKPIERRTQYLGDGGKRMVSYDDFFPREVYADTQTLLLIPVQVQAADKHSVGPLGQVGDDLLPARVKNYIKNNLDSVHTYLDGPYFIELFGLGDGQIRHTFTLDADLNIRSVLPMNMRHRYYLRVSAITDQTRIPNAVIKDFLLNFEDTLDAMYGVAPNLEVSSDYEEGKLHVPFGTEVTVSSYNDILRKLPGTNKEFKRAKRKGGGTVLSASVIARRR